MRIFVSQHHIDIISFCSASSSNVTMVNQTDLEYSIRQLTDAFYTPHGHEILQESCTADFPKLYTDKLTATWMVEEEIIDEWTLGPLYRCCKFDANVVVDYPPQYDLELCTLCVGKLKTEYIPGVGEVEIIEPCKEHRSTQNYGMSCNSAHDLKLSVILGISLLASIT